MASKLDVLIVDPIHSHLKAYLNSHHNVTVKSPISRKELLECIEDVDLLVLRSGAQVDRELLERGKRLSTIVRAGTGTDNIDLNAVQQRGIDFYNTPSTNARSVAELSFGLMHCLYRHIKRASVEIEKNLWNKKAFQGFELSDKTLGLVGFGSIGQNIASIAKGYGMSVHCKAQYYSQERASALQLHSIFLHEELDTLLSASDIVVVCCPYGEQTKNLIARHNLPRLKSSSILINVARGGVVCEEDLYHTLASRQLYAAASDVFVNERQPSPLFTLDNFVGTPHIGAMTHESQKKIAELIIDYLEEKKLTHYPPSADLATYAVGHI
ncbi:MULTISPECIES: NAD(P)-dependent oxidoreductase [Pseudomonas]|uniref:NAD(P)-dependent oxidoreductase n=1 Tax=Pseudomonas TaxID=286 RepID=UPI00028C2956|nr:MULTISPECIES: NAD(P)-dependent oxidoreductase [Pseudomonas]EKG37729.1 D-3-phosphoglycerate dehydrogenase [Pseudomonas syringae pv. avellanae str. ISPaVe037]